MTPEQFCYWLQGYVEVRSSVNTAPPSDEEWKVIKDHLGVVFGKVTPRREAAALPAKKTQKELIRDDIDKTKQVIETIVSTRPDLICELGPASTTRIC